jgi:long-subunit acyl-CoA synthetase (AMP-forming)
VITDRAELFDESKKNTEKLILQLNIVHIHESSDEVSIPAETSKITFTSGSTGQPKGVCLSVENQYRVALSLTQRVDLKAPIHLCVLPLSTLLENVAGVYAPLLAGGQVRFLPAIKMGFNGGKGFCSEKFIAAISQQQPNSLIVLPELLLALLDAVSKGWHIPESLQFIAVGGSRVSPDLLIQARELGLPVYEGYGLSECGSVVSLNSFKANRPGTVGKVLPHLNVQLVDGQVVVTGNTFLGYLNHPDSWYKNQVHTGDLAEWDTEGYLHIRGRIKNLLISSFGRNINPEWLESEVMANPMIHHCVVLGDAKPYCSALIQKRNAAVTDADVQQWIDCINLKLPDYAQICQWQKFSEPLTVQAGTLTENGRPVRSMIDLSFKYQISDIYKEVS